MDYSVYSSLYFSEASHRQTFLYTSPISVHNNVLIDFQKKSVIFCKAKKFQDNKWYGKNTEEEARSHNWFKIDRNW